MSLDPRARTRVQTVSVRPSVRRDLTNEELLTSFLRSLEGKRGAKTLQLYRDFARDAIRYFVADGAEVPVRAWTKEEVAAYVHFAETSYCANLKQLSFMQPPKALCKAGAWTGPRETTEAAQTICATCPLFRRTSSIRKRLDALNAWFSFLSGVGAIPFNFVRDVADEWKRQAPRNARKAGEKKRNPTPDEMRRLVNGTAHPARRAFYAASAKWAARPNEMLSLDRFASFGLAVPEGCVLPRGFENAFRAHPELRAYDQGGRLAYIPEKVSEAGAQLSDKRTGNRWLVVDDELRPILDQYFSWWDRTVKRDAAGRPVTTRLWLRNDGTPEEPEPTGEAPGDFSERWFYPECERLGLMAEGDRKETRRKWSAHCQRHFSEQVRQMANVPADWNNHFRGDAFTDARGDYFQPRPDQVLQKWLELMPRLGFKAVPDAAA